MRSLSIEPISYEDKLFTAKQLHSRSELMLRISLLLHPNQSLLSPAAVWKTDSQSQQQIILLHSFHRWYLDCVEIQAHVAASVIQVFCVSYHHPQAFVYDLVDFSTYFSWVSH